MKSRRLRVFRFKRDGRGERFDEFDVPVGPTTTVLDALLWIKRHRDRSLAFRHSCLHASCGTCGVQLNGREVLACVTPLGERGGAATIEPLANLPVLTDLVVDQAELYARFYDVRPLVRSSERGAADAFTRYEDCLECGLCLSACPIAGSSDAYVGPAALAQAQRLLEEPRGAEQEEVLDWADRPDAAWRCHAAFECTQVCPGGVDPAARIMALRGALLRRGRGRARAPA